MSLYYLMIALYERGYYVLLDIEMFWVDLFNRGPGGPEWTGLGG